MPEPQRGGGRAHGGEQREGLGACGLGRPVRRVADLGRQRRRVERGLRPQAHQAGEGDPGSIHAHPPTLIRASDGSRRCAPPTGGRPSRAPARTAVERSCRANGPDRGGQLVSGRLDGVATLVTGAASGIGRGVAERFVQEGARVLLVDVDEDGLARVATGLDPNQVATAGRRHHARRRRRADGRRRRGSLWAARCRGERRVPGAVSPDGTMTSPRRASASATSPRSTGRRWWTSVSSHPSGASSTKPVRWSPKAGAGPSSTSRRSTPASPPTGCPATARPRRDWRCSLGARRWSSARTGSGSRPSARA